MKTAVNNKYLYFSGKKNEVREVLRHISVFPEVVSVEIITKANSLS